MSKGLPIAPPVPAHLANLPRPKGRAFKEFARERELKKRAGMTR